ncbi:gluconolactonase [Terriglobus roseus DSM 18391]|uniref:Gluconolactonase n=1 Tax=Terriglobus roseus (strain DSM 18391 / NRRL B-41598 / KBS 63) TaxID=926566 RepID=I3ZMR8_TERRK|nr:Ig-like domain repeat protein [Terriglobus roseus]AFL90536.1 gluconolactonase [Terriglobus roseus DSM 18391]
MLTKPVSQVSADLRSKFTGILRQASLFCAAVALSWATSAGAQTKVQHLPGSVAVGITSPVQPVTLTVQGTVASIRVVTQGSAGFDFADAGGGSCTTQSYLLPQSCTVNVTVSPAAPGRRLGAVVLRDSANRVLASQAIDMMATGPLAVIRPGILQTIAGNNPQWQYSSTDEGAPAYSAHIFLPSGVAMNGAGELFVSDSGNNRVRKVTPAPATAPAKSDITKGTIVTYAGGDVATSLSSPAGLAIDGAGNLYVADSGNNVIRRIDTNGVMTTVAGQVANSSPYAGDGLLATAATLNAPWSVALDPDGNLFIADTGNNAVRRVDAITGIMTTVASNLNAPRAVVFDPSGVLYVADSADNTVLRVNADGSFSTYVGISTPRGGSFDGDGGAATAAHLNGPAALAFDPAGNLYIADSANNRVRRVDALSKLITTVAGNGGTVMDDTVMNSDIASFSGPYALFLDNAANLYVGDLFHNRVRQISSNTAVLTYPAIRVTKTSAPQKETLESDGTTAFTPGDLTAGNSSVFDQTALDAATTTCRTGNAIQPGSTCVLGVEFAPTVVSAPGSTTPGSFTFKSDASNAPDIVYVSGQVLTVEPTAIALSSNANPSGLGSSVTFTAIVAETDGNNGNAIPTGTVTFTYTNGTGPAIQLGSPVTLVGGVARTSITTLALGQHTITANYSGNSTDAASTASLSQSIVQNTVLTLSANPNPSYATQTVTLSAKLTASTGNAPIAGATVTFFNGTTAIGTAATTDANGIATTTVAFPTATPAGSPLPLTASFGGDTNNLKSTSNVVSQTVNATQTTTLLSASPNTAAVGTNVTLTATVSSINGPLPTGTVTFKSGATTLGTGTLDANGSASLATSSLPPGQNPIVATYSGDASNLGSTSVSTVVTVTRLTTNTILTSSAPNSNAGSTLNLTANVTLGAGQTAVGAISGIVTFYDGATVIGSQQVVNGVAVLTTTNLKVGTHNLTASYSGNTNYDVSTSAPIVQTVQTSSSTTVLSVSSATAAGGKPVTLTATVNTAGVKATGNVTFTDGATVLGTVALNSNAVASLTVTTLPVGQHNIVATYNGDPDYNVSASSTSTVSVSIGNTALALTGTPGSATYSAAITLTATMTSDGALPSNPTVTLTDNGAPLTSVTISAAGNASFVTSTLSVGTHTIVAQYAGDPNNAAAQSQSVTITIEAARTTTSLTSSNPASTFGDTVTLQATVASPNANLTGTVTFQEGSTNLGTVAINSAGVASLPISNFSVAQHSIVAIYSGDSTHSTSTSAVLNQSVVAPTNISLSSSTNPAIGGNAVTFTAQVAGAAANSGVTAAPTGTMIFHEGATVLGTVALNGAGAASLTTSSLTVGSHNIVATYSGDVRYGGNDSAILTQVIRNASSQSVLTTSANPSVFAAPLTLTVRVTGNGGAPTGNVNFLDGTTTIGQAALNAGTAVFTTSSLAPGIHSLSAIYVGDSNNSASTTVAVNQQVQQITQIAVVSSSNPALTLDRPTLTATVRTVTGAFATGNVRFTDGTVVLGTSALTGGVATLVPNAFTAGTHSITVAYSGDTSDLPSVSPALQLIVNLRPTQNTVTATLPTTLSGGVLTLISVLKYDGPVSPTGVTTFSTATGVIGSASVGANGIATLNVQGSAIPGKITATYSGDASYSASTSQPTDITTASATNFTLSVTPTTFTVASSKYVVSQITLHSNDGFSDTINLGCGGMPYAATCTFDHDSIKLPANGTVTVKVTIDTGAPLTSGGQSSASVQTTRGTSALALLPAGAVLILLAFGRRKRNVPALLLLLLASALLPVMGCGTINQKSTPAGAYNLAISAVGQGTGVTLSQVISMTVTQ